MYYYNIYIYIYVVLVAKTIVDMLFVAAEGRRA